jgi:hypothetical protein
MNVHVISCLVSKLNHKIAKCAQNVTYPVGEQKHVGEDLATGVGKPLVRRLLAEQVLEAEAHAMGLAQVLQVRAAVHHLRTQHSGIFPPKTHKLQVGLS